MGAALSAAAAAQNHDRTQFGNDITIGPNEEISEATCFGCNVRVHGNVKGDITVFGGSVIVEEQGQVGGDVTDFGRGIRLNKDVKVRGDVTVFGGQLRRDAGATVGGDVTSFSGSLWILLIFVFPLICMGAFIALIVWLIRRLTRPSLPATA